MWFSLTLMELNLHTLFFFFFFPKGKIQCYFFHVLTSRSSITDYGVNIS